MKDFSAGGDYLPEAILDNPQEILVYLANLFSTDHIEINYTKSDDGLSFSAKNAYGRNTISTFAKTLTQ